MSQHFRRLIIFLGLVFFPVFVVSAADVGPDDAGVVAVGFLNAYVTASPAFRDGEVASAQWLAKRPDVTERFRKALARLYAEARRTDPEAGYGSDAVVGGQDYPGEFRVLSVQVEDERAKVVLIGTDPGFPMEVKVALVRGDGRWMVDGSGDVAY